MKWDEMRSETLFVISPFFLSLVSCLAGNIEETEWHIKMRYQLWMFNPECWMLNQNNSQSSEPVSESKPSSVSDSESKSEPFFGEREKRVKLLLYFYLFPSLRIQNCFFHCLFFPLSFFLFCFVYVNKIRWECKHVHCILYTDHGSRITLSFLFYTQSQ